MELKPEDDAPLFGSSGYPRILMCDNVCGGNGVFVCGSLPVWMSVQRGILRAHPYSYEGAIHVCAPFHNMVSEHGLIHYNEETKILKVSRIPEDLLLEQSLPIRRIGMKCTVHQVIYDAATQLYVLITSEPERYVKPPRPENVEIHGMNQGMLPEEEDEEEPHPRGIDPMGARYRVKLVSPLSWQVIDSFELNQGEKVLCGCSTTLRHTVKVPPPKEFPLAVASTQVRYRPFIAIGTGTGHGELTSAKGRVILFEISKMAIDATHENGQLALFFEREARGACTAMADLEGHLIINMGAKILVHKWDQQNNDLIPCAFHDAQVYAVSMRTMKNFIIIGDIHKSIHVFLWMDRAPRTLKLLGSDFARLEVFAVDFLGVHRDLAFTCSDSYGNIRCFEYSRKIEDVDCVEQLLPTSGIRVGSRVSAMMRLQMLPFAGEGTEDRAMRLCNLYACTDGSIGFLCPLDALTYKRLYMLQMRLIHALPHHAGLHPAEDRICKPHHNTNFPNVRNIIDGDLVARYVALDSLLQEELAKSIATSSAKIMQALFDFNRGTSFF